jgi:hypothetical protein
MSSANIDTLTLTACQFIALANTITFASTGASGHSVTGCTFDGCGQIDAGAVTFTNNVVSNSTATSGALVAGGGDMDGTTITGYEGTADTSALIYNETGDPDGELDNMNITKGTASTHAIEFGTSSPTTMTLRGIDFSGFNASDAQNDSTLRFLRTTGTITVNLIGCSGNISYKKEAGATVNFVIDPRTITIEIRDDDGVLITDATEVTIVKVSDTSEIYHAEDVTTGSTSYQYTYVSDVDAYINVLTVANYEMKTVSPVVLGNADQTVVAQLAPERGKYSNPV